MNLSCKSHALLIALLVCGIGFQRVQAQCDPDINAGSVDAPAVTTMLDYDFYDTSLLEVSPPPESETGLPDYVFLVTTSENIIVGLTEDGIFDPSMLAYGTYRIWGMAYSIDQLSYIATQANPLLPALDAPAMPVPTNMQDLLALIEYPAMSSILNVEPGFLTPKRLEEAISALMSILASFGITEDLCYDISDSAFYSVEFESGTDDWDWGWNGINDSPSFAGVQNSPNPFSDFTTISFDLTKGETVDFMVYDLTGKNVLARTVNAHAGTNTLSLQAAELGKGVYFYSISNGYNTVTRKMVVR